MPAGRLPAQRFTAELAAHWYRAGQRAEALSWSVRAADRTERVYAHGEAARHCERVLEPWDLLHNLRGWQENGPLGHRFPGSRPSPARPGKALANDILIVADRLPAFRLLGDINIRW
jgi:hypothetical protein